MRRFTALLLFLITVSSAIAQPREILLIGTINDTPEIARGSYLSLYKIALDFAPTAIYVQYVDPSDEVSWQRIVERGGPMADFWNSSLLMRSNSAECPVELTIDNALTAITYFEYHGQYVNAAYYDYLLFKRPKKAVGNELVDVAFRVAAQLGIQRLESIDYRGDQNAYNLALSEAISQWSTDGNGEAYARLFRSDYMASIAPAMFGNYARHANSSKALRRAHLMNSFEFAPVKSPSVIAIGELWQHHNNQIAINIGTKATEGSSERIVVLLNCTHIWGVYLALREQFPDLKISTIENLNIK